MSTERPDRRAQPALQQRARTSKLAIISCLLRILASLAGPAPPIFSFLAGYGLGREVVGLVGFTGFYLLLVAGAIVPGHLARRLIRRSQGTLSGSFYATTGLVLGYATLVWWGVTLLLALTGQGFWREKS